MTAKLVLGSSSPYRRALLGRLGLPFDVRVPDIDETPIDGEAPQQTACRLAAAKAVAVKVKVRVRDVAAVGMISVVVNHAVTTAVSVRLPRLPHPLLPLPHRLRHRSRRQRRLRPSRAVQTSSRRFWMHRCRAPKAQWPVNARAALGAAVAVVVAAVGVDVIGRPAPPAR